jgi:hypothetical protein
MILPQAGPENTENTLITAIRVAQERKLDYLIVASTYGDTALKALELIRDTSLKLVVVTHNSGFSEPGAQQFSATARETIEAAGHRVLSGTMVLRNLGSAIRSKFKYSETEIVNATLRMFCQGIKVAVEIAAMAADAGLVPTEEVMCVAGTGKGADTAAIIKADSSNRFFDIKVREIVVKPYQF